MSRPPRRLVLVLGALASCGNEAPPRWVELARGFEPEPLLPLIERWKDEARLEGLTVTPVEEGFQVELPMGREDWSRGTTPGRWTRSLPGGPFAHGAPGFLRLAADDRVLHLAVPGMEGAPGTFTLVNGRLELVLPPEIAVPERLRLGQRMENGRRTSDGVWQVRSGDEYSAGIPVWSGRSAEVSCDVPPASRLHARVRWVSRSSAAPVTLRIRLDGDVLWERAADSGALAEGLRIAVDMPAGGRARARLAFEVLGPGGAALFLAPVLGPAAVGRRGERPWVEARPDIVLFLADTFRADNLASNGGASEHTPRLNRFAEGAARFRNARANAAWTLPSISTLLTGLAPGQHTANEIDSALPGGVGTLVEALARSGYRTGAVTDASFFAPRFGLDQGFETFAQHEPEEWDLRWTVERALEFLDHDDGRPVFLVVHTYRTHMPYRVGDDEDRGPWQELKAEELRTLGSGLLAARKRLPDEEWRAELAARREGYRSLYLAGVRALDAGFGNLLDGLEPRGIGARACVVFTSDHGEALGENDDIFHAGDLWDSKLRVPLLVHGPGFEPADADRAVTLLDVAPTLADLARVPADPRWGGRSLLAPAEERPAFAFRLQARKQVAICSGARKLLALRPERLEAGEFDQAFDLAEDPREERDLAADAPWAAELARGQAAAVQRLLEPASGPVSVPLSPAERDELRQLGYGGDDDE